MSLQLAIFVSGRGSNMEAILNAVKRNELDASIQLVFSNDEKAAALDIARQHGVRTEAIANTGLTRKEHEEKVVEIMRTTSIDYIVLAGYMRILSPNFLQHFRDPRGFYRIINIHPSLLPAFPGKSAYDDAFNYGVKVSGITVHLVDEKVDHGAILAQKAFDRLPEDTLETFKARGLQIEHALYPSVLQDLATNGIRFEKQIRESVER